ncbi:MAG: hypothetical protein ACI9WU_001551 [Myxococcota bacterium]|jgi:hypothetical protein
MSDANQTPDIDALARAEDVQALAVLARDAADKKTRKAAKRALYRLEQRGVSVPELSDGSSAPGRQIEAAALPIMMAPPQPNDGRRFTLALSEGASVLVVEARFEMPIGLDVLQSSSSGRAQYHSWSQKMCARDKLRRKTVPQRVQLDPAMLERKRWEMGRCSADDRLGGDVDTSVLQRLAANAGRVPHPMETISTDSPLDIAALSKQPWRLPAFDHTEPLQEISQHAPRGISRMFRAGGDDSGIRQAAGEWADEWGAERLRETILDVAAFCQGMDDQAGAETLATAAKEPREFLVRYAVWRTLNR